jgi:hypothetical protein
MLDNGNMLYILKKLEKKIVNIFTTMMYTIYACQLNV